MPTFTLENANFLVKVRVLGAEMQSLFNKKNEIEYLWQADANYWPRHAPVLFPIVGRLPEDNLHHGQDYPMTQHGFARDMLFDVTHQSNERLQFRLAANEKTKAQYPFDFELLIDYQLVDNQLTTQYTIRNLSNEVLPASIGAHPAFNWPLLPNVPKESHTITFEKDESKPIRQLDKGLMLEEKLPNPIRDNKLSLKDSLFENDALIFDELNSRSIRYDAGNEQAIEVRFNDFPHLGIWTKPGAPFVCLEPWHGYSSPVGFEADFINKPGLLLIPEKSEITKSFQIIVHASE